MEGEILEGSARREEGVKDYRGVTLIPEWNNIYVTIVSESLKKVLKEKR